MKKILLVAVLVALFTVAGLANEMQDLWKTYKPGTYVKYKLATSTAGMNIETESIFKLKQVTPTDLIMENQNTVIVMGNKTTTPPVEVKIPLTGDEMAIPGMVGGKIDLDKISTGKKSISVGGKSLDCFSVKIETEKSKFNAWMCKEIPMAIVDADVEASQNGQNTKIKMTLVDFKIVK